MTITVVQDTITWALYEAEFRRYMELVTPDSGRQDELLERMFGSAAQDADDWIDNPFDGVTKPEYELTGITLGSVKLGIFAWCFRIYYGQGPDGPRPGLTSVKTDSNAEGFAASRLTKTEDLLAALDAAKPHWAKFQRRWGSV